MHYGIANIVLFGRRNIAIKGGTAIRVFKKFPKLRVKPYWGNHFWAVGYRVDTVGLDADVISKYVKYQEIQERALAI